MGRSRNTTSSGWSGGHLTCLSVCLAWHFCIAKCLSFLFAAVIVPFFGHYSADLTPFGQSHYCDVIRLSQRKRQCSRVFSRLKVHR